MEERNRRNFRIGANFVFWSLVFIIASIVILEVILGIVIFTVPRNEVTAWALLFFGNFSSMLPQSLNAIPVILILIGISQMWNYYKKMGGLFHKALIISFSSMVAYLVLPYVLLFMMMVFINLLASFDLGLNILIFILTFINILVSFLFLAGLIIPVLAVVDIRTRKRIGTASIVFMAVPTFIALDNLLGIGRLLMSTGIGSILGLMYFTILFAMYSIPLFLIALEYWKMNKWVKDGKDLPMVRKTEDEERSLFSRMIFDYGVKRPWISGIFVVMIGLLVCIPNGIVGIPENFEDEDDWGEDPLSEFWENGAINLYSLDGYLDEGSRETERITLERELYFVDASLSWEDEGDFIRWTNTPDTFMITISVYAEGELIDQISENDDEGYISIYIDYELEPVFIDEIVIEWEIIDAGDYEKRFGPVIFEQNTDVGNDWTVEIFYAYLAEE